MGGGNQRQRFSMDAFLTLLCFNFMAVNIIMSSEVRHFIASEILMEILDITRQTVQLNWSVAGLCREVSQQRCM